MKKQIIIFILMLLPIVANAYEAKIDGIYYNFWDNKAVVTYQKYLDYDKYISDYSGSVIIPESVTYNGTTYIVTRIDMCAFRDCSGLTSITIPNSVTSVGLCAFEGCSGLTSVTIPEGVKSIDNSTFRGCSSLTSVTIPEGVTSIGNSAFYGCWSLTSVTIPNSVARIVDSAFEGCSSLTSINIPNSVNYIGGKAFSYCSGLTSISIPNSVTNIGDNAFFNCTSLTSIKVAEGNTEYDSRDNCNAIIETATNTLVVGCNSTIIPNSVTNIGALAFTCCSGLTSITIPNSVTSIGHNAFERCSNLTSINIPNSVTSIGALAFYECSGLTSITIPNSVTSIGALAFSKCSSLTSINIPNSVTSIGEEAFYGCSGLKDVYCFSRNVPTTGSNVFESRTLLLATLHVLNSSIEAYRSTAPWSSFKNIVSDNIFVLTYEIDGIEYKSFILFAGQAITPEPVPTKEGFTFSGWSEIPVTMPAHDVTITGSFTPIKYKLTYMVDGAVYKSYEIDYASSITPEANPTKEGHTFSGWGTIPETMPAHDVEVNGTFSINSYTLTYKVDGEEYKTSTVVYGSEITPEAEPAKEGYTFSGWSEIPQTMPAKDVEVTGTFAINKYKLTYIVNGVEYKSYKIEYSSAITPEAEPTKAGYTFSGWSEIPERMPAHNVTVIGTFSVNSYTLTYMVDGEVYKASTIAYGTTLTPETEPTKEGYTFSGWSEIPAKMPAHDVEVAGTFTINKYKLTYIVDGEEYKSYEIDYSSAITPEAAPIKEGHTFSGWSEIPATMPAHDVVVTGSFSINSYKLTYKVDGEVGAIYKTLTVAYGTAITPEPAPTLEGYTFSGWSEIPKTMPAHDVVVTGSFSINSYMLTYKVDGEVYKTAIIAYGTELKPEAAPTKEGYTFSGWSEILETMPASDVVVTGSFTINQYKLSYILDGKEYKSYELDYDTTIIPESVPVKKGMTFSGWGEVPDNMPDHDVTLTGTYSWTKETLDGITYQVTDTLGNYASVIGYDGINGDAEILSVIEMGGDAYIVNSIGSYAFNDCTGLISITLSSNVTSIDSYAFSGCTSLSSVTIGKGVTLIGNNAFNNVSPKKVIWLPKTPPNGYNNIVGAVNYTANNQYSQITNVVVYPYLSSMFEVNGVKYVPVSPSERTCDAIDCTYSTENLNIGETAVNKGITLTIKNIGPYFCYGNTFLKEITISNQGCVGSHGFDGCSALHTIELGQGITSINNGAFANCTSITEIHIPKKVNTIEDYVFSGCTSLKIVHVDFSMYELNLGSNGSNPLFADCPLDSVYIGRDITYPTTSNKGYSPFYRNKTLRLLTIADNETDISAYEFYGCTSLKSVRISDGMKVIGDRAFSGCSSLEYFSFGFNVRTIGKEVFSDCAALSCLISRATTPPTCGLQALDDINKWECTLIVPQDHIAAYQQADQWKEFFFIEGGDFEDVIRNVKSEIATGEDYYDLNGRKLKAPQKGINIIRYLDGTTRKVMIK